MKIVSPGNHPTADEFWEKSLGGKPNGARTLGSAMAKYFPPLLGPYFDLMVCYSASFDFEIPEGTRRIAVFGHQNHPHTDGFKVWQKVNLKLKDYETVYFYNDPTMVTLIKQFAPCYLLPRFIDTELYPNLSRKKTIDTLWLGNVWGAMEGEFDMYKRSNPKPYWISKGVFGLGDKKIKELNRTETLKKLALAKKVWAIGVSQLEAKYYGCEVVSYKNEVIPYYDQHTIIPYLEKLLKKIEVENSRQREL